MSAKADRFVPEPPQAAAQMLPEPAPEAPKVAAKPPQNVLVLSEPLSWADSEIRELRFPTVLRAKHLRRFALSGSGEFTVDMALKVAADCLALPDNALDGLSIKDTMAVYNRMVLFFVEAGLLATRQV